MTYETVTLEKDGRLEIIPAVVHSNTCILWKGPRGSEEKFIRTQKKCPKGRTIFQYEHIDR